jgi:hypothetical protein
MRRAEVVVLVLILSVFFGLLASGINRVNEKAARERCRNNLKQIGLALYNYESTYRRFPAATMPHASLPPERRLSWLLAIMPFVECGIFPMADKEKAWDAEQNRPIAVYSYAVYFCPANPDQTNSGGVA